MQKGIKIMTIQNDYIWMPGYYNSETFKKHLADGYPGNTAADILLNYEMFVEKVWYGDPPGEDHPDGLRCSWRDWSIMTCGLGGETGEVLEKCKKFIRDRNGDRSLILKELGDTLYYLTKIAHEFDFTLADVIHGNIKKLTKRVEDGTMHGDGDTR
jgi:NTP pyrophosphatase (non-canonical NTP hydrolase)